MRGRLLDSGVVIGPFIDHLVPSDPDCDQALREALGKDAAGRLRRALRRWRRHAPSPPEVSRFAGIPAASGPFRCWLADVEDALEIASLAARARAGRRGSVAARARLIERVADAGVLARLAPQGRVPRDFAARALREARRQLTARRRELADLTSRPLRWRGDPEVGELLIERGLAIVPGGKAPQFERRVTEAMSLLQTAWPEGAAMVRERTWRVVPVTAWATVSYSSSRQPGVAYINVNSAPRVRLAEDLVHETTHVRVHEIEALDPLVASRARASSDGTEPRFYSPWRREWRPLRGLVHAVCTFTAGAMFFETMLAASERGGRIALRPARRRWLARRLLEERASVAMSLGLLRGADRKGLLTSAGRRVVRAAAREHLALARAAGQRAAWLRTTPAGRRELAKLERLAASLRRRPLRWGWRSDEGREGA